MSDMCQRLCRKGENSHCCDNYLSGQEHLDKYQLRKSVTRDLVALTALLAGFHLIAIIVLSVKMYLKKK